MIMTLIDWTVFFFVMRRWFRSTQQGDDAQAKRTGRDSDHPDHHTVRTLGTGIMCLFNSSRHHVMGHGTKNSRAPLSAIDRR